MTATIDSLPEWHDSAIASGRNFTRGVSRRRVLKGGIFAGVLAATMTAFDFVGTKVPAYGDIPTCTVAGLSYATDCNGGASNSNNACDKGCVSEPQHSFYCVSSFYGSRHRTCGEEQTSYDGNTKFSFRIRPNECYLNNRDGWRWEMGQGRCGCGSGQTKKASCTDGYYNTRPINCDGCWGPTNTSVCRRHSVCVPT